MHVPTSTLGSPKPTTPSLVQVINKPNFAKASVPSAVSIILLIVAFIGASAVNGYGQDTIAPGAPYGLTATAATCGQVDLSWSAPTDTGGSGLLAYSIIRADGTSITIGAVRTHFSDTNFVRSSSTLSYYVVAQDGAGNKSAPSNTVSVTTPSCPVTASETVVDGSSSAPLGRSIATYGSRSVVLYQKFNLTTYSTETWASTLDSDTGTVSKFLLHTQPSYPQTETDYVLTSSTELWVLSCDAGASGNLLVSQYRLNGTPPSSATLLSTKSLGDSNSKGKSLIRLQSGGLMVAWNEEGWGYRNALDLSTGFAYRSPSGSWSTNFPVTIPNSGGGNITMSQFAMAQHPTDGSIWTFIKRDSFAQISAVHFTETSASASLDWINPTYITQTAEGANGPEGEFPFLAAAAVPSRSAILLAYQTFNYQSVFTDPLYGSLNSIFLKEAPATIAQISADGSKNFIPFPTYMERTVQFGMSAPSDGSIWLTYQPINHMSYTWNEVYSSKFDNGTWSDPVLTGYNYQNYNVSGGGRDPGALIGQLEQPRVAFLTPDRKIRTFDLSNLGPAPADNTQPTASIYNPANGSTLSGSTSISVSATDNVAVVKVELSVDGSVVATSTTAPYFFSWNTNSVPNGNHTLQATAYDAAGNAGVSPVVTVGINNASAPSSSISVVITNPSNGSVVARNQKVTINAAVSDSTTVTQTQFFVNNKLVGTATAAPFACGWKVPAKSGVKYNVQAKASDAAGRTASQTITVIAQ